MSLFLRLRICLYLLTPDSFPCIRALPRLALPIRVLPLYITDLKKPTEVSDLMDPGYRLGYYRHVASDPRYPIKLPAWDCLENNSTHHAPLRVDGQAGRPKKRKASNGEFHASSLYNGVQLAQDSSVSHDTSFPQGGFPRVALLGHPST